MHVVIEICRGLTELHSRGIAHRDIKVENVLRSGDNYKLCDFGSASKVFVDPEKDSKIFIEEMYEEFKGSTTLMYRPPEMYNKYLKYKVDQKVDIWMLGCVLFILCFIEHPFEKSGELAILNAQYFMPKGAEHISKKLRDLIFLLLVPDPAERPSAK